MISRYLAAFLVAMVGGYAHAQDANADVEGPRYGGTFVAAIAGEPGGLNPVLWQGAEPQISTSPIFDPLIRLDMDANPTGVLAESWEVSEDRTTFTFNLRDGVTWHDGEPFTSEDVLWTFLGTRDDYMPHPRYQSTLDTLVESYEAPDPDTFVIKLKHPYAPFLTVFGASNYAMPIVPKHVYDGTDIANNEANWAPVGTGPFKFKEWVRGSHIELVRNENYFIEDQPRVDSFIIRIMPDETARLLALKQGEVDYLYYYAVAYNSIPELQNDPNIVVTSDGAGLQGLIEMFHFNLKQEPFDDLRVRQAFAHLLDRELINQVVYYGLARPTGSAIGKTVPFWNEEVLATYDKGGLEENIAEAERLLDEAGYTRDASGNRFEVTLLYMSGRPYAGKVGEVFNDNLSKVGIRMTTQPMDRPAFIEQTHTRWDYKISEQQFSSGPHPYLGLPRYLLSSQHQPGIYPANAMGYENPEVDKLFEESTVASGPEEEAKIWAEVQRHLSEDLPILPIVEMPYTNIYRAEWKDVFSSIDGVFDVSRTVWSVNGSPNR
ncbi:ABC transporter substrate-binding protein [Chelativorans sp. Marseille-P2723]|uniref:ABC transporter substrate-binding protein n=1 Tax=Chelativorans sp. Marseille-P2723 TaxID=2709133 RepID=UPI00156D8D19|nr:ABC transporter substrate-binding protein [Chelativorans sp. Marseille-P2723]